MLLIDTAGRLQNKAGLMAELEKIVRVMRKFDDERPARDAARPRRHGRARTRCRQVELFRKAAGVTGLVMTKLDGTARGGILVALAAKFGLPVHFIGVGEGVEDLEPFEARDFARAIAGLAARERRTSRNAGGRTSARCVRRLPCLPDAPPPQPAAEPAPKLALELGPLGLFFFANA